MSIRDNLLILIEHGEVEVDDLTPTEVGFIYEHYEDLALYWEGNPTALMFTDYVAQLITKDGPAFVDTDITDFDALQSQRS